MNRARMRLAAVGLAALAATSTGCGLVGSDEKKLVAYFDRAVGVYVHSDVRVLGVPVGEVTAIEPVGKTVKVEMTYDSKYKVPADAKAVVVSPSIVSDRYVQLAPVWREGPTLPNNAELGVERTAVPVELDDINAAFNELNVALGPQGANKEGALSQLLDTSARNLEGNGELLGSTLNDLSLAISTLAENREDLFATVANLQDFTTTLARSDQIVRQFNTNLADVAAQLSGERKDLAEAVRSLSIALGEVAEFVRANKKDLNANVADLASTTGVIVKQKGALAEYLDAGANGLSNLALAYNPANGTLDTRDNGLSQFEQDPFAVVCEDLKKGGAPEGALKTCEQIRKTILEAEGKNASARQAPGSDRSMAGVLEVSE